MNAQRWCPSCEARTSHRVGVCFALSGGLWAPSPCRQPLSSSFLRAPESTPKAARSHAREHGRRFPRLHRLRVVAVNSGGGTGRGKEGNANSGGGTSGRDKGGYGGSESGSGMGYEHEDSLPYRARESACDYLTQRAVQQLMFTSRVLRDETSSRWLDEFAGGGLDDRHVCDALRNADGTRVGWRPFLRSLLTAEPENLTIRKPVAGRGGSTATNPYLKPRYFTYDVQIVPRKLARQVLSARVQIARELEDDLQMMTHENDRLWRCFRQKVEAGDSIDVDDPVDAPASSALFDNNDYGSVGDSDGDGGHSPYRAANYDLALNYTLHIATIGVIQSMNSEGGSQNLRSAKWLKDFCDGDMRASLGQRSRAASLLLPPRGIRRAADAFVAALLAEPPIVGRQSIIDPMNICEQILEQRVRVAHDYWIPALRGVEKDNMEIERELLEQNM